MKRALCKNNELLFVWYFEQKAGSVSFADPNKVGHISSVSQEIIMRWSRKNRQIIKNEMKLILTL